MSEVGLNDPDVSFQGQQSLMLNENNYKKFELTLAILTELLKQWHRESQTVEDQKKKFAFDSEMQMDHSLCRIDCFAEN